ncbi:MAG: ABC transporter permease subunit [Ferruginibacter sp.]
MFNQALLKIEWLKIKKYKPFYVLLVGFLLAVVAVNLVVLMIQKKVVEPADKVGLTASFKPYSFEFVWQTISYTSGYLLIIPAMLMILLVTNEYAQRTHRQNIIDGWSRMQFIQAKLSIAIILALIITSLVALTGLCFGYFNGGPFRLDRFDNIGFFAIKSLNYLMLAVLVSVLVKKTGFAIGVYFLYMGGENFLSQFLYGYSVHLKSEGNNNLGDLGDLLPMNAADGLLLFPDNPLKQLVEDKVPHSNEAMLLMIALAYCFLMAWWAVHLFKSRDL